MSAVPAGEWPSPFAATEPPATLPPLDATATAPDGLDIAAPLGDTVSAVDAAPADDPSAGGAAEPDLVRPFIVTRGRTRASRPDIRVETLIEAIEGSGYSGVAEERRILEITSSGPTSVAEIGAHSGLPVGVVTILTGDLLDAGAVRLHHTDPVDIEVSALTRMIERVRAL